MRQTISPRRRKHNRTSLFYGIAILVLIYFHVTLQQLIVITSEEAKRGEEVSPVSVIALSNEDELVQAASLLHTHEPSDVQLPTEDDMDKKALQWLQTIENNNRSDKKGKSPQKFDPPPGYYEHSHQEFNASYSDEAQNLSTLRKQQLLQRRQKQLLHPILPKRLISVIGPESSGSTFLATTLAHAAGVDYLPSNKKVAKHARTVDGSIEIQHLSLPWGGNCEKNGTGDIIVNIVDAMVPEECSFDKSLHPSLVQDKWRTEYVQQRRNAGDKQLQVDSKAQLRQQCRDEVLISEYSNLSCGAECGTGVLDGFALYPGRFSVNITSHIDWYLQRGVDVTVILTTRDRSISMRGKENLHCKDKDVGRREEEVALALMTEGLDSYGAFGSVERNRVIVMSYEGLMSIKDEYLFGLYKQLRINSTYVPSFIDGNEKYVTDANEANIGKNADTSISDISARRLPKPTGRNASQRTSILPKKRITVVGLEGSGSIFLFTALSEAVSTDDAYSVEHITLPNQTCESSVSEINITSHIQRDLKRGIDIRVILFLRDKTITNKEKLRNRHCTVPPETDSVEYDTAIETMREAYRNYYGEERVVIVSYEGLMQLKQSYLFEVYKKLGIDSSHIPDFVDENRLFVPQDSQHQMMNGAANRMYPHKKGHIKDKRN